MSSNRNNLGSTIDPGIVQTVARGGAWQRRRATGFGRRVILESVPADNGFFGPNQPLPPAAQDGAIGRAFDYATGYNLQTRPRAEEGVQFSTLRGLADACNVLRLVIETRKDQICRQDWAITARDGDAKGDEAAIKAVTDFLALPDREHTWDAWLRMLVEDMLVIDAATLYPRATRGGGLYALEPIDGATIKRLLDITGRTPMPPDPAYQQIIKGLPAVDYTADELVYLPRNPRTNRVYGFSPVEQIIMTVNTALRRDVHRLEFYTEGTLPDMLMSTPEGWQPGQIQQFQEYWDALLSGQTGARRKGLFLPSGFKTMNTKEAALKDEFDEWLARVVCFAFSISPTPFVKQVNRATAQTSQETATEEGLHPLLKWIKSLMDILIIKHFGRPELEFSWQLAEDSDPLVQAQVHQIYATIKVLTPDEIREDLGRKPLTPDEREALAGAPSDGVLGPGEKPEGEEPPQPIEETQKLAKAAGSARETKLAGKLSTWLAREGKRTANEAQEAAERLGKGAFADVADIIMQAIGWRRWDSVIFIMEPFLDDSGADAGLTAFAALEPTKEQTTEATPKIQKAASEYAGSRSAEMVGRRYNDVGELVDNPNARWSITEDTRAQLRDLIDKNLAEGTDPRALAKAIRDSEAFSKDRAMRIARTELSMANQALKLKSYREAEALGLHLEKGWTTAQDGKVDGECQHNAEAGYIRLDDAFPSGHQMPPAHPNCRCGLVARRVVENNK